MLHRLHKTHLFQIFKVEKLFSGSNKWVFTRAVVFLVKNALTFTILRYKAHFKTEYTVFQEVKLCSICFLSLYKTCDTELIYKYEYNLK